MNKMSKKILISSISSVCLLANVTNAEIKLGNLGSLSATAGVMSQYISRGVDQNSDRPTAFASVDFTAPIKGISSDLYLGVWAAGATGTDYGHETDVYAGIKKQFGSVTADLGIVEYQYHGDSRSNTVNNIDYYLKLTYAPDKAPYSLGISYFVNDSDGTRSSNKNVGDNYKEFNASYDFGPVKTGISLTENNNDTQTWSVTMYKTIFNVDFALSYIDARRQDINTSNLNKDREYLNLTASKTF